MRNACTTNTQWAYSSGQFPARSSRSSFLGLFPGGPISVVKGETMRINPYRRSTVHAMAMAFGVLAPLAAFGQAPSPAKVTGHFAGNWVEDQSQRKTGAERSLTFRNGPKGLEELRGSYSRPLVEPVH